MKFNGYGLDGFYDEMFAAPGMPRPGTTRLVDRIESLPAGELARKQRIAERALFDMGITFNVYGSDGEDRECIWPVDLVPRVVNASEWDRIEKGLQQRIYALNEFIHDIYHDQKILRDRVVPRDLVESADGYFECCMGLEPPKGVWCHITGTDLVRDEEGTFRILEDNLRCPSGVSYVLANRELMKRTFSEVFTALNVRRVADYPARLLNMLCSMAPDGNAKPTVAVLSPGVYNAAYFEHAFLAQHIGAELVEGCDLVVSGGHVCMKTTRGLKRVDVIYRRINDDFLDPCVFRAESVLGVPGLMEVYRAGRVALVNAPGTGVADDKAIYAYSPKIIRYYLDEEPILPIVDTHLCGERGGYTYTLEHLDELVVKATNASGGYNMLVGPHASAEDRELFAEMIKADPRNFIAQPTLGLSRSPVIVEDHFEGRHVDLRPFILYGDGIYVLPGGLTRVALRKGSLVVNSSQGGGSKDTWVVDTRREG